MAKTAFLNPSTLLPARKQILVCLRNPKTPNLKYFPPAFSFSWSRTTLLSFLIFRNHHTGSDPNRLSKHFLLQATSSKGLPGEALREPLNRLELDTLSFIKLDFNQISSALSGRCFVKGISLFLLLPFRYSSCWQQLKCRLCH